MREFLKRTLPPSVWGMLREMKSGVKKSLGPEMRARVEQRMLWHLGMPLYGAESTVEFIDEDIVKKTYLPRYFDLCARYERSLEGEILALHQDDSFVHLIKSTPEHLLLERLAWPLGTYRGIIGIRDPNALFSFFDTLEDTLEQHDLHHHDIHPGNVLYDSKTQRYKLIDFGWARERNETYVLPSDLNPRYSPSDAHAIEMLKRDADAYLAKPSFLGKLLKRDRNAETQRARGLAV